MINEDGFERSGRIIRPANLIFYEHQGCPCGRIFFSDGTLSEEFFSVLMGELEIFDAIVRKLIVWEEAIVLSEQLSQSNLPSNPLLDLGEIEEILRMAIAVESKPEPKRRGGPVLWQRAGLN